MGRDKALLDAGGLPFIARVVRCLGEGGASPVVVVVRPGADAVARTAQAEGARIAVNPDPDNPRRGGPLSSLRVALGVLPGGVAGLVLHPVDFPAVEPRTVTELIAAFRRTGAPVVAPTWLDRRGHPVLLSSRLFHELLEAPLPQGARTVVRRHASDRVEVPVDDPGILQDLNTPDAYRRAFPDVQAGVRPGEGS